MYCSVHESVDRAQETFLVRHSEILLRAGYNVILVDSRRYGLSQGAIATYGWFERADALAIVDALVASEHPTHLFALRESMGAGIALQCAAGETRIEAVVAPGAIYQPARRLLRLCRPALVAPARENPVRAFQL